MARPNDGYYGGVGVVPDDLGDYVGYCSVCTSRAGTDDLGEYAR